MSEPTSTVLQHFAVVTDYFDDSKQLRVFVCTSCGALVADRLDDLDLDGLLTHREFHDRIGS